MEHVFRTSRLTVFLALLAGLMALGATGARAEHNAYWLLSGFNIGSLLPAIQGKKDSAHIALLFKFGLIPHVEILCTDIKFVGAKLHELGRATGKAHFDTPTKGCITKLKGVEEPACKPKSLGASLGLIETNSLEGLIKLHTGGVGLLEVQAVGGGAIVTLELGATCPIGNKIDVTGKVFLKDGNNEGLVDKVEHLFEAEQTLSTLRFGANPATLVGSGFAFLSGLHTGLTFAGHTA